MSTFIKQNPLRRLSLRLMVAQLCFVALSQESSADTSSQSVEMEAKVSDPVAVSEGRKAVAFYQDQQKDFEKAESFRLTDNVLAYPVGPVERLRPLLEIGDPFLGNGPIRPGLETPTGQMLQPWFLLYGTFRSALQSFEYGGNNSIEWANRLDLHGNLNLSGTERLLFSLRPLDGQGGGYTGYNFEPNRQDGWQEDFNARVNKLYFEGELGEIFPGLDPSDSHTYDIGFSIGRQQLTVQDGILVNDNIDLFGITRNSLVFDGISNLRLTGIYGWNHINRGNNDQPFRVNNHSAHLFGLLAEADTAWDSTLNLDLLYVGGEGDENAWYVGASSTQRLGWLNSTFRVNASIPEHQETADVGKGILLLSQLSSTLPGTDNIAYFNAFWNIDRFTSAARSPDLGSPLANLGILFGPVGMGRYGVPLGGAIDDSIGAALGYQMFLDGIDSQLIFEAGARTSTRSNRDEGALGFGIRYQRNITKNQLIRLDSFVTGQEGGDVAYGLRTEWMIKF